MPRSSRLNVLVLADYAEHRASSVTSYAEAAQLGTALLQAVVGRATAPAFERSGGDAPGEPLLQVAAVLRSVGDHPGTLAEYAKHLTHQLEKRTSVVAGSRARRQHRRSDAPPHPDELLYDEIRRVALEAGGKAAAPEAPRESRLRALAELLPVWLADRRDRPVHEALQAVCSAIVATDPAVKYHLGQELKKLEERHREGSAQRVMKAAGRTYARQAGMAWPDVPVAALPRLPDARKKSPAQRPNTRRRSSR